MRFYVTFKEGHSLAGGFLVLLAEDKAQAYSYACKMLAGVWKGVAAEDEFRPEFYPAGQIGPVISLSSLYVDPKKPKEPEEWEKWGSIYGAW